MIRNLLLFSLAVPLAAQNRVVDNSAQLWLVYEGVHPLKESKWRVHLEGQWRRHDAGLTWQQLLLRPGIAYAFSPKVSASAGYAFVETWPYGVMAAARRFSENRIWEQVTLNNRTGKASWLSRFRFENRWIGVSDRSWRYENRLRLMQRFSAPISPRTYFVAFDEYFLYVKPYVSNSIFDQNRAFAGIGRMLANDWRIEAGYMNQTLLRRSGAVLEVNHTIRVVVVSGASFRGK